MTKMITAATILRMIEEEKYQKLLPNGEYQRFLPDGIETKLSDILPLLKEHYPQSKYITEELERQPDFERITLQNLAQHTSGLARVAREGLNAKLREGSGEKLTLDAMIDADKLPKSGKYGENIGEYSYNDLGYELLGRIVITIASETAQSPQKFGDVVNELVIDEVRKKVGPEESATLKFFTSDQMEINESGKTQVKGHPELRVEFGKHYHDQKFSEVPSHTYDLSCGGSYTTPESMSIIALHILSGEQEFSIFKEQETCDVFNSRQVPIPRLTPDGKYKGLGFRVYGFGYESFSIPGYERYRDHGGLGYGSNSNVMVDTKENKVATTMVAFEDLTLPLAYALTKKEKPASSIKFDLELHQKTLELSENYSESQLLEMRNSLEKSYEDFRERFDSIQRQKFSRIDNPQENLALSQEARSKMSDAFAQAHIDKYSDLSDEAKKQKFLFRVAKALLGEKDELSAIEEVKEAIQDKEKLSALFLRLDDEDLVKFNWDKDGLAVIKSANLTEGSIQKYCDDIDFRGVMVVEDGKGNQTKVSNYHKGAQEDPADHPFATHSVSKLIGGVAMCKMIADGIIPQDALDRKLELSEATLKKLPAEILKHLEEHNVTLRDVMTHHSGLGGYLDPELKEGQKGYEAGNTKLGYGVNGYSGYVRQQLEKGEAVEVPTSPQDYLKYSERETYEHDKFKYSDLGIVLASLSAEHHYNKTRDPSEHKSFEEIVKENLIIPAGVEKFAAQKPADAIFHSDDPIAPYITGTAGCGYWTNLDGLVKIGKQIGKMWQEDTAFRDAIQNCGQEFYDEKLNIIRHPGGIDSSKTLLSVDLNNGSIVVTEERRLGSDFPFPGWGVVATARDLGKETTSGLLKQVREFYQNVKEEDRKLINQFTEEGVDLLVDYYNTKYPERGQIHRVQAPMTLNVGVEESGEEKNSRTSIETQEASTQGLSQLLQNNRPPLKVMLTFLQRETSDSEFLVDRGRHSIPLLITDEKLILLRDEGNPKSLAIVAQNLGLRFVQQKDPAQYTVETEKGPKIKSTSIQGDHSNCNGIAVGILKDLTAEDVAKVSAFEDRYTPLPKMLKYSQSENFILRTYPELANEPVKFDKEGMPQATLIQYVHDNSHQTVTSTNQQTGEQEQKEQKTGSRIGDKMDRMRQDMSELQAEDKGRWAQKILEKRAQEKESQSKVTER